MAAPAIAKPSVGRIVLYECSSELGDLTVPAMITRLHDRPGLVDLMVFSPTRASPYGVTGVEQRQAGTQMSRQWSWPERM